MQGNFSTLLPRPRDFGFERRLLSDGCYQPIGTSSPGFPPKPQQTVQTGQRGFHTGKPVRSHDSPRPSSVVFRNRSGAGSMREDALRAFLVESATALGLCKDVSPRSNCSQRATPNSPVATFCIHTNTGPVYRRGWCVGLRAQVRTIFVPLFGTRVPRLGIRPRLRKAIRTLPEKACHFPCRFNRSMQHHQANQKFFLNRRFWSFQGSYNIKADSWPLFRSLGCPDRCP